MLETDWIKVGTAGRTVDGREIVPEMLESAGRLYSLDTYTAGINSEHFFFPGLGFVSQARAEADAQGRMALWTKLVPSAEFLARNQSKRQLFFSMELTPDFPGEGDWYLTGLAITEMPASQGLAPKMFRAGNERALRLVNTAGMEASEEGLWRTIDDVNSRVAASPPATDEERTPGWARNFLASIGARLRGGATSTEEEPMNEQERQELNELKGKVAELTKQLTPTELGKTLKAVLDEHLRGAGQGGQPGEGSGGQPGQGAGGQPGQGEGQPPEKAAAQPGQEKPVAELVSEAVAEALKPVQDKLEAVDQFINETRATEALEMNNEPSGGEAIWY